MSVLCDAFSLVVNLMQHALLPLQLSLPACSQTAVACLGVFRILLRHVTNSPTQLRLLQEFRVLRRLEVANDPAVSLKEQIAWDLSKSFAALQELR